MIQKSKTWEHLKKMPSFLYTKEDLTPESLQKIVDTTRYSLRKDPGQDREQVMQRCMVATMAEQAIAKWTSGFLCGGDEDYDNPYSFAFDVVSKEGVRIEVKTHQSGSKWISVHTGHQGDYPHGYGINLGPFMQHKLADLMIMLDVKETLKGYRFKPKFLAGPGAFVPESGLVQKSQGDGWYLRSCSEEKFPYHRFTS